MSMGIFIKGLPIGNANGVYNCQNTMLTTTNRIWDSVDNMFRMKYTPGTTNRYFLTSDVTYIPGKKYYLLQGTTYVEDTSTHDRAEEILSGTVYEHSLDGRWSIVRISSDATGSVTIGEELYMFYTSDEAMNPYDSSAIWLDKDGGRVAPSIEYWDESSFITEVSDPVVDENAGTVTTVTTTTNIVTGSVYKETNVVRTKLVYKTKEKIRYDNMNLSIGKVYRFQFVSDFKKLGYIPYKTDQSISAGIFKVDKVMTYLDTVASGIDIYANLYQPLGVSKDVYTSDIPRISDSMVYRLVDPVDKSRVFFVPQTFIEGTPDPSVDKYNKLLLTINLGVQGDPDMMSEISFMLTQLFEKMWGIQPEGASSLVELTTYDNIWLAIDQKRAIDTARKNIAEASKVNLAAVFDLDQNNAYYLENLRLKGRVGVLESIVKSNQNNSNEDQ